MGPLREGKGTTLNAICFLSDRRKEEEEEEEGELQKHTMYQLLAMLMGTELLRRTKESSPNLQGGAGEAPTQHPRGTSEETSRRTVLDNSVEPMRYRRNKRTRYQNNVLRSRRFMNVSSCCSSTLCTLSKPSVLSKPAPHLRSTLHYKSLAVKWPQN